jgi:hypothetical protein
MKYVIFVLAIVMMPKFVWAQDVPNDETIMACKPGGYSIEEIRAFALSPTGKLNANYRKELLKVVNAGLDSCGCNGILDQRHIGNILDSSYIAKVELVDFMNSGAKGDSIVYKRVPYYFGPVVIYRNRSCPKVCLIPTIKDTCANIVKAKLIQPLAQDVPTFTSNGKTKAGGLDPANAGGPQGGNANGGNGQQPIYLTVYLNADGTVANPNKKDSTVTPPVTPAPTQTAPTTVPVNMNTSSSYADAQSHQEVESHGSKHPKWCNDCHRKWRKCACRRYYEASQRSGYSNYASSGNVLGTCGGCGLHLGPNHCGGGFGATLSYGTTGYQTQFGAPIGMPSGVFVPPAGPVPCGTLQQAGPGWAAHVAYGKTGWQPPVYTIR